MHEASYSRLQVQASAVSFRMAGGV